MTDFLQRVDIKSLYGEKYPGAVAKARALLSKCPPENFTSKWETLKDESFRKGLSDNDSVVVLCIAFELVKPAPKVSLFWCDDWILLSENFKFLTN